jgi:hypothetical protein
VTTEGRQRAGPRTFWRAERTEVGRVEDDGAATGVNPVSTARVSSAATALRPAGVHVERRRGHCSAQRIGSDPSPSCALPPCCGRRTFRNYSSSGRERRSLTSVWSAVGAPAGFGRHSQRGTLRADEATRPRRVPQCGELRTALAARLLIFRWRCARRAIRHFTHLRAGATAGSGRRRQGRSSLSRASGARS